MANYPSNQLTVIIRDDGPLVHANDAPSYRSVRIELSDAQLAQLGMHGMESISRCFIEPEVLEESGNG